MYKLAMVLSIIVFFIAADLKAEVVYLSSLKTSLYSDSNRSSAKVTTLNRGSSLVVMAKNGNWLKVRFMSSQGWVEKLFTSSIKPGNKVSLLGSAGNNARVHARKRASSDVTAASARGLLADNKSVMGRARDGDLKSKGFDEAAFNKIEKIFLSEDDLLGFLNQGGLK